MLCTYLNLFADIPLTTHHRYFTKDDQHGVCVFRRRKSGEQGHRGFRLSSLGILLAKARRPRPWRHTAELKDLIMRIYSQSDNSETLQPTESHWEPARAFFNERKVRRADLGGAGDWNGWSHEFDEVRPTLVYTQLLRYPFRSSSKPTLQILTQPSIFRISSEFWGHQP